MTASEKIGKANIVIIKIGTSILTTLNGELDLNNLRHLVHQICEQRKLSNRKIIIVSSGAITCGSERLKIVPDSIPEMQASAAVGQILLMQEYTLFFGLCGVMVGQLLLTKDCFEHKERKANTRNTIFNLLENGAIPIINENDTIATDDIKFGDNDDLSSRVARLLNAELLIMLTDIDGLYSSHPSDGNAKLITEITEINNEILDLAKDKENKRSRGGMKAKLIAAREAAEQGISVIIADGRKQNTISNIFSNFNIGTYVFPKEFDEKASEIML